MDHPDEIPKMDDAERHDILQNGLPACICENPGMCPLFREPMSSSLHGWCQRSQAYRDGFVKMAKKNDASWSSEKAWKKRAKEIKELQQFDKATEALADEGIDPSEPSEGLGDTVEKILKKFGITKKLMANVSGAKDCRCNKRREWLNKIFKYKKA